MQDIFGPIDLPCDKLSSGLWGHPEITVIFAQTRRAPYRIEGLNSILNTVLGFLVYFFFA